MKLETLTTCPLSFSPPFVCPWRRALHPDDRHRLEVWCAALLPEVTIDVVEWVGADPRHPIHAVVVSFPSSHRPPITLYMKVEDVERRHLAEALETSRRDDRSPSAYVTSRQAGDAFIQSPPA